MYQPARCTHPTFEPSLQSDGTVNYDHEAADDVFSSRFWGSLAESDTRSVQSTTQFNGWDGQYWLFDPQTVTRYDSYPKNGTGHPPTPGLQKA